MAAFDYLRRTPEIRDVLISGGDALALGDDKLDWILRHLARYLTSSSSASARKCLRSCRNGLRASCAACCGGTTQSG